MYNLIGYYSLPFQKYYIIQVEGLFYAIFIKKKQQQILKKADVSRRTLWQYFNSKSDLMDYCLDNFIERYYLQRDNFILAQQTKDVFLVTLNFISYNREFIRSFVKSGHFSLLQNLIINRP